MKTSDAGRAMIERFEGVILHIYNDFAGIPTIGVGHRILPSDPYKPGALITRLQADEILANDLRVAESCVNSFTDNIGQNMFDALVSLGFNIGTAAERTSTVAKMMRVGAYVAAADAFMLWDKYTDPHTGQLVVSDVLRSRRADERAVFMRDVSALDIA